MKEGSWDILTVKRAVASRSFALIMKELHLSRVSFGLCDDLCKRADC